MNQTNGSGESWGTRLGVILAVTGSAVGLGNFLRFPGLAAKYGGGAFLIPYAVAFLLLGLPIAWAEWALGRYGGRKGYNSVPGVFWAVTKNKFSPYLGVIGILVPVMIYMYYVFIEAWCLGYAVRYAMGKMDLGANPDAYGEFFGNFVGANADGTIFSGGHSSVLLYLLICFILNFVLIYRGLSAGIEWFCKWAMPALVVCAIIVLVRVLTLPTPADHPEQTLLNGLGYMWNPGTADKPLMESLKNPEIWLAAAGQIFFSLSVGFGVVITYASYLKPNDDVALSAATACAGNGFCEVALGGMITIPAAFVFLGVSFVQNPPGTFGMGFVSLPNVFNLMPAGRFFGFLFFFLLFLAAVTSSLSMLQPAIAFLEEGLNLKRKASVALLGFITAVGTAFIVYFSAGFVALDTIDFWVGTFFIYVLATIQTILFAWVLGMEKGMEELNRGAEIKLPGFLRFVIKFVSPAYLLIVFVMWLRSSAGERIEAIMNYKEKPVIAISVGFIIIVATLFLLLVNQAVRTWAKRDAKAQKEVA